MLVYTIVFYTIISISDMCNNLGFRYIPPPTQQQTTRQGKNTLHPTVYSLVFLGSCIPCTRQQDRVHQARFGFDLNPPATTPPALPCCDDTEQPSNNNTGW